MRSRVEVGEQRKGIEMVKKIGMHGFVADDRYEVVCALEVHGEGVEIWRHDIVGFAVDYRDIDDGDGVAETEGRVVAMFMDGTGEIQAVTDFFAELPKAREIVRRGKTPEGLEERLRLQAQVEAEERKALRAAALEDEERRKEQKRNGLGALNRD